MPTVDELKEELRKLGEKVGGRKAELEARLKSAKSKKQSQSKKRKKNDEPKKNRPPAKRAKKATDSKQKKKKAPTTYKEQIMELGRSQQKKLKWTKPLSLAKIKAGLIATFRREDGGAFRKLVTKTLKSMVSSGDIIKVKGSYREPKSEKELEAEEKKAKLAEEREDKYKCAWCKKWSSKDKIDEAPDARGCSCKCDFCGKKSWQGIGQGGSRWFPRYRNGKSGWGGHY